MDSDLIIFILIAGLLIGSAIYFTLKTPPEKRGMAKTKNQKKRIYMAFFFSFGLAQLLAWYWKIANEYALYFGLTFILVTLIIWITIDEKKST